MRRCPAYQERNSPSVDLQRRPDLSRCEQPGPCNPATQAARSRKPRSMQGGAVAQLFEHPLHRKRGLEYLCAKWQAYDLRDVSEMVSDST